MDAEKFQKERRDWWKTVYLDATNNRSGSVKPDKEADKALRFFDKRFKQEKDKCDELRQYHERELTDFTSQRK